MGTTGTGETVTPAQLRAAAVALGNTVPPHLSAAESDLAQTTSIQYSNFTAVAPVLASAYVAADDFMKPELGHLETVVQQVEQNLDATAKIWAGAEQKSTVPH